MIAAAEQHAVRERPILMSAPMVRAIIDGRKTQTRRVIKPQPQSDAPGLYGDRYNHSENWTYWLPDNRMDAPRTFRCLFGDVGDRLWVRETWSQGECDSCLVGPPVGTASTCYCRSLLRYRADDVVGIGVWRPSIHMPRWASRITLEVTDVRVERLQDISEADARSEGVWPNQTPVLDSSDMLVSTFREGFASLWDTINGMGAWEHNPWVWVVEFKRLVP